MRRRSGFSLVELLVVIGIIALLMGILVPALNRARAASRQAQCLSNIRQLGLANQLYLGVFKDRYVPGYWGWSQASGGWPPSPEPPVPASSPRRYWFHAYDFARHLGSRNPNTGRFAAGLVCPDAPLSADRANRDGYTLHNSYAMNYQQLPGVVLRLAPHYTNVWRRSQVLKPAEKIQFVDATSEGVSINGTINGTMKYFMPYFGERHEAPDKGNIVAYRHNRGANVLFYDGHAQWMHEAFLRYDRADARTTPNRRQWEPLTP